MFSTFQANIRAALISSRFLLIIFNYNLTKSGNFIDKGMLFMSIFDYMDYKKYVNDRIKSMPRGGHGEYLRLAKALSMNSVNVSQVFKGERHLSAEHAFELCELLGLSPLESRYFRTLVDLGRAGSFKLKESLKLDLEDIASKAQDLKHRVKQEAQLSEEVKAIFYSQWYYSGIRLLTSIEGFQNIDQIAAYYNLPTAKVSRVIEFLVQTGLCKEEAGMLRMGPASTHIGANHPLVSRHHTNWRMKGLSKLDSASTQELFFTMPCSLSEKAMGQIRKELLHAIDKINALVDQGPAEKVACLNMDWFELV